MPAPRLHGPTKRSPLGDDTPCAPSTTIASASTIGPTPTRMPMRAIGSFSAISASARATPGLRTRSFTPRQLTSGCERGGSGATRAPISRLASVRSYIATRQMTSVAQSTMRAPTRPTGISTSAGIAAATMNTRQASASGTLAIR